MDPSFGLPSAAHRTGNTTAFPSKWVFLAGLLVVLILAEIVSALSPISAGVLGASARIVLTLTAAGGLMAVCFRRPGTAGEPLTHPIPEAAEPDRIAADPSAGSQDASWFGTCVAAELQHFHDVSDVLKDATERVIEDADRNAISLMTELRVVETGL